LYAQVFNGLCKAYGQEPRAIIRQAIAILTPAIPQRMEDGHQQLINCIRKIMFHEEVTNDALQSNHLMCELLFPHSPPLFEFLLFQNDYRASL
jgi:hypothetical protein